MKRDSRLELRHLRVLAALVKEGSVSAVAEHMHLTQQAVSANLSILREVFDDRLFVRTGHGVVPTALAQKLALEAADLLSGVDRMVYRDPFNPATISGKVNLSATDYSHAVAVVPSLQSIRGLAPGLKLILSEVEIDKVADKTASGDIDLVVSVADFLPNDFPRVPLFTDTYVCVGPAGSDLCKRHHTLEEIADLPQVIVSPTRPNLVGSADSWFQSFGLTRNVIMSVPYFSMLPKVVESTGAIAFLPSRLLHDPRIVEIDIEGSPRMPEFETVAAWHPRASLDPVVQWLVERLVEEVS